MSLFSKNPNEVNYQGGKKHFVDILKNRSNNDTFIFKNPEEDFNNGSTLIVSPGEQAIFINQGNIEQVFDSGTYTLHTQNYPFITRIRTSISGGISGFNCLVYFVRTATVREIMWGTPSALKVYDKAVVDPVTGIGVETEVRARGSYRFKVKDAGMLLTHLIGANYTLEQQENINDFFRTQFQSMIQESLAKKLNTMNEPIIQANMYLSEIGGDVQVKILDKLAEVGLEIINFSIAAIDVVDNENRRRLQEMNLSRQDAVYGAQAEALRYQALGTTFQEASQLDIARTAAGNEGGAIAPMMGAGMGIAFGASLGGMAGQIAQTAFPNVGGEQAAGTTSNNGANAAQMSDVGQRLAQLKTLFEQGLITEEEFTAKKSDIINSL